MSATIRSALCFGPALLLATLPGIASADYNRSYLYNAADQLVEVKESGVTVATHAYDGDGERIRKSAGTTQVLFVRGPSGEVLAEYDDSGNLIAEYVYLNGKKVARIAAGGATTYYHSDHLGTPRAITNASGQVTWQGEQEPFGEEHASSGARADSYTFTGHEHDVGIDLIYAHARYYDPEVGRFITTDPAGGDPANPQSWNRYGYALNNPIRFVDPDGRTVLVDDLAVAGLFLTTGAIIAWWDSPAPGDPTFTNGQVVTNDAVRLADSLAHSFRKIGSPDRYKSKDQRGRDRDRERQDRSEKKEPKPEPASDNDPPSPEELVSPGPLRIPPGAGTLLKHGRATGDLPGGGGDPSMGAAGVILMAVTAHEVGTAKSDSVASTSAAVFGHSSADESWKLVPSH